jgi:copper resistance protein C
MSFPTKAVLIRRDVSLERASGRAAAKEPTMNVLVPSQTVSFGVAALLSIASLGGCGDRDADRTPAAAPAATASAAPADSPAASPLRSSTPAEGATVNAPKTIVLNFSEPVRVERVALAVPGAPPVELPLPVPALAESMTVALPDLKPGHHTVAWSGTLADGRKVAGSLSFTVA